MTTVRATEKFSVYWNYQVWQLTEGQEVSGGLADHLLATSSPVEDLSAAPAASSDGDGGVPSGTVAEVLDWVGGDQVRADLALEAEKAKPDGGRATLIAALEKLLSAE